MLNPYHSFLSQIEKPSRYIGGEKFSIIKDWNSTQGKMVLAFPDTYEIGMGHLGFKILYEQINKQPHLQAQRVFCPWVDMEKAIREHQLKLCTLETFTPLDQFNVVGFSLQYELCYTNILTMLDLSQIPIYSKDRLDHHPIVMAGGPVATHSMPMDEFFDCVVIGDGEELVVTLLETISSLQNKKVPRIQILKILSEFSGVYVPSFYTCSIDPYTQLEYVNIPSPIKKTFYTKLERLSLSCDSCGSSCQCNF